MPKATPTHGGELPTYVLSEPMTGTHSDPVTSETFTFKFPSGEVSPKNEREETVLEDNIRNGNPNVKRGSA